MLKQKSVTGKIWHFRESREFHGDKCEKFCREILENRGLSLQFLSFQGSLPDQKKLPNIEKATQIALEAIKQKRHFVLIGDYDVDGVTSTALLYRYLTHVGVECQTHIPHRINDGYGSVNLNKFPKDSLFFAVDWGSSVPMDADVIVLDHHATETISNNCVVNPHMETNKEFQNLPAVGITFFFLAELSNKLKEAGMKPLQLRAMLDLVMAGIICDVMPMSDQLNRFLVRHGLKILNKGEGNLGIKTLLQNANSPYNEESIAFDLGPKINASSRMDTADIALQLLVTESESEAAALAQQLVDLNQKRKEIQRKMQQEAMEQVESQTKNNFIMLLKPDWHTGLIGVIAGQLLSSHSKPVFVMNENSQNLYQGSARSVDQVDVGQLVRTAVKEKILATGGGHKKAAGFTMEKQNLSKWKEFLTKSVPATSPAPYLVDKITTISSLNQSYVLDALQKLAPFGEGYSPPLVVIKRIVPKHVKKVNQLHFRFLATSELGGAVWVWSFFSTEGPLEKALLSGNTFDMLVQISPEFWQGEGKVKVRLVDIA